MTNDELVEIEVALIQAKFTLEHCVCVGNASDRDIMLKNVQKALAIVLKEPDREQ